MCSSDLDTKGQLEPPIIIENELNCSIIIRDYEENANIYFLIYRNYQGENSPLIKIPKDRYQHVHFINMNECRIFVETKLVRVYFYNCHNCQISITQTLLGMTEMYKCKNMNLTISTWTPWIRIEESDTISLFQSSDELIYVIKMSCNIKGTIINSITKERLYAYEMGKLIWDPQEQNLICLSRDRGFMSFSSKYILNDIEQHVIVK